MEKMKLFLDTHDSASETFPQGLTAAQFAEFYPGYEAACYAEGVVPLTVHLGLADERAFCLTLAPDAEAVQRAHQRAGLPFASITEVTRVGPSDTFGAAAVAAMLG